MSEELQGLLNRIESEGLKKAEEEHAAIVARAKTEAEKILSEAKEKAEKIVKDARKEAGASQDKANETIRQAARDVVVSLRIELLDRLRAVVKESVGAAMTPAMMADLVKDMASKFAAKPNAEIEAMLPANKPQLEKALLAALTADLKKRTVILAGRGFGAGLKIGFKDGDVFFDFSDDALSEIICEFVGPKLAAVLHG